MGITFNDGQIVWVYSCIMNRKYTQLIPYAESQIKQNIQTTIDTCVQRRDQKRKTPMLLIKKKNTAYTICFNDPNLWNDHQ